MSFKNTSFWYLFLDLQQTTFRFPYTKRKRKKVGLPCPCKAYFITMLLYEAEILPWSFFRIEGASGWGHSHSLRTCIEGRYEGSWIAPQPNCSLHPLGASRLVDGDFVNMEIIVVMTQTEWDFVSCGCWRNVISMSGGTADFFYREARRLKFVARSAFKVNSLNHPARSNLVEMVGFGFENIDSLRFWLYK